MSAADGRGPAPPPLRLAWFCGDNHLPETGGVLDQDYVTMNQMTVLGNVYRAIQESRAATGDRIHKLPAYVLQTIAWLQSMGINVGLPE